MKNLLNLLLILLLTELGWAQPPIGEQPNQELDFEETKDNLAGESYFSPIETQEDNLSFFEELEEEKGEELGDRFEVLPPDEAFVFSTYLESPTQLVVHWQIAEGHYLYRDKFQFALTEGNFLGEPQFPLGTIKDDIKYGRIEVYEQVLEIKLPLKETFGLDTLTLTTTYQGCAEAKLCYPPIEKTTIVTLPAQPLPVATATQNPETNDSTTALDQEVKTKTSFLDNLTSKFNQLFESGEFLAPEAAFIFSAEFSDSSYLVLKWQIADGYYLYRDKFKFSSAVPNQLGTPQLPPSVKMTDPQLGEIEIYQQPQLEIKIPLQTPNLQKIQLTVEYQGCAFAGLCYPPLTKSVALTRDSQGNKLSEQDRLANMLANANMLYTLIMFFGLGLLLSLTPCVYPMIPILSSLIVGQSQPITTYKAFIMSLTYVLAMATTYAVAGVLTGLLGENLSAAFQNPWILVSFALMFVILSLSMFGFYELQMPSMLQTKLTSLSNRQQGGTLVGVAMMGVLSALIVGPCVAAPLVGALIYISQTGDALLGGMALFFLSLGMGVPLILVGISAGHWLPKVGEWMESVKAVFGVMLLAVAIWMLERIMPGQVTLLLWASLLIISATYMGALDNLSAGISGWYKLWKGLGLILLVYGILLMIGVASGSINPLQPLSHFQLGQSTSETSNLSKPLTFKPIKGLNGLNRELTAAQAQNQPVMLDFYADWCISCKEMEHLTFADAKVQQQLTHFVLLQADVTLNDEQDQALYKHFGIYGPPAILFFDPKGQEQRAYRVVGFMPAEPFNQHLKQVLQL